MLAGHYAAALAAKKFAPRRSLGTGFIAAQFQDILWAAAILLGIEHARIVPHFLPASPYDLYDFPWTHGLVAAIGWAALLGLLTRSVVFGVCAFSHWVLDFVAHWHDLPVLRQPYLGLGLWKLQTGTFLTEAVLLLLGLFLYLRATRPVRPGGGFAVPLLVLVLIGIGGFNVYGPAPASMKEVGIMAELSYAAFAVVAFWCDRLRTAVTVPSAHWTAAQLANR